MNTKKVSIGLALLGVALQGAALTIGPAKGAAWIGRPLELNVPVQRDAQTEGAALCAEAEVFFADSRLDPSQIQIQQEPTEQADTIRLRVRTSTFVNEPIVNLTLRVGCEQKSQRRFVLLADLPLASDPAPERAPADVPAPLVTAPLAEASTVSAPAAAASAPLPERGIASVPATPANVRAATPTPRSAERKPTRRAPATNAAAPKVQPPPAAATDKLSRGRGARLQLDPLEVLVERVKTLEAVTATPPADIVSKESELLLRMESDLKSLREQAIKNEATLATLQKRLEQAESDRVAAELFYGLLAVVVVCAVAVVALWHRRRAPPVAVAAAEQEEPVAKEPEPYEAQFLRKKVDLDKFEAQPMREPPNTHPFETHTVRMPARPESVLAPVPVPVAELDLDLELEPDASQKQVDVNLVDLDASAWPSLDMLSKLRK
ncbi:MAG: hypothetical protein HYX43_20935 [Burkholderiales bacterium]|nr:hypothetical protein [Burkholderiales bacterium]